MYLENLPSGEGLSPCHSCFSSIGAREQASPVLINCHNRTQFSTNPEYLSHTHSLPHPPKGAIKQFTRRASFITRRTRTRIQWDLLPGKVCLSTEASSNNALRSAFPNCTRGTDASLQASDTQAQTRAHSYTYPHKHTHTGSPSPKKWMIRRPNLQAKPGRRFNCTGSGHGTPQTSCLLLPPDPRAKQFLLKVQKGG